MIVYIDFIYYMLKNCIYVFKFKINKWKKGQVTYKFPYNWYRFIFHLSGIFVLQDNQIFRN